MNIPVFPLPIYLLPGGITRLRIFEQRYLNMVKNARNTDGFVISLYRADKSEYVGRWGSWVEIIDFQLGQDNVLVIDVKCNELVLIDNFQRNDENLLLARKQSMQHWPKTKHTVETRIFSEQLKRFFSANSDLNELYKQQFVDQPNWVCARWLELFPISIEDKNHFAEAQSVDDAIEFLTAVIIDEKRIEKYL
ncbi:LON peptidase substrate-binding domain-containing protein [Thalassotalea sp. Y01]|uniref:LON peptidase substrate-binding domain-containing protein n=1 Tax=Thalassotalea sp. Y01 TaxID=2729613 RepID=UPI00145EDC62|nr:LON peptidase substrate-binding domain-containing protein [Thalassotalea sp. Y01]NMP15091.1 ATP-dependent protease [Thalassotalea sp. Y01]